MNNLREAAQEMLAAAEHLFSNASERGEVLIEEDDLQYYEGIDTWDEEDEEHYYPEWLDLKRAIESLRSALEEDKSCT